MATEDNLTLENFTCSICRDIYKDPVSIPCGNNHIVCKECVQHVMQDQDPKCPVCRSKFRTSHVRLLESLKQDMARTELPCFGCGSQVIISQMNQHLEACDRIDKSITYFKPVKETSQLVPRNLPNRSTFKCPYCNVKNLDTTGLVKHCNERHSSSPGAVVCPVCASMPWGNKGQTSMNFIQHLNMRHNFEYDTYVPSIDHGTLSEDSEDSNDILSFHDDVIRSKDSQKDGILNHCEITKLLLNKGRKSQEVFKECQKICKVIKDESEHITHVEAAYRFEDDKHVIFLVFAAENIEIDLIWETEIRIINTFSDESSVVLHCKENSPLTEIESQRIGEIIDMHSKKLMSDHKFLSAISASSVSSRYFGPMTIKHLIEKRPCIVFNVLVKGIIPLNEECFPTELDGKPVDVREGGVRLCVNKADEYQENATLGCKITSSTCPGKSGTLGGFIEHPEYGLCGITCAHVVANDDDKFKLKEMSTVTVKEDHIMYQPGDDDKSKNRLGKLVQLTYKEGENGKPGVDLALFRIEKRAPKEGQFPDGNLPSFNTGLVWGKTGIPSGQRNAQKFGYVTLNTSGVMQFDNCAIKEEPFFSKMTIGDDRLSLTTTLFKQYQIKSCDKNIPFCKQGDSGALVFMEDNTGEETTLRCIGMLVGLTDDNSGYVTPITAILDELKVKQLKPFTTHSTNSTILEQISGMLNTHFDRFNERFRQLEERISRIEADNKK